MALWQAICGAGYSMYQVFGFLLNYVVVWGVEKWENPDTKWGTQKKLLRWKRRFVQTFCTYSCVFFIFLQNWKEANQRTRGKKNVKTHVFHPVPLKLKNRENQPTPDQKPSASNALLNRWQPTVSGMCGVAVDCRAPVTSVMTTNQIYGWFYLVTLSWSRGCCVPPKKNLFFGGTQHPLSIANLRSQTAGQFPLSYRPRSTCKKYPTWERPRSEIRWLAT